MERYYYLINKKLTGEIEPWEEVELLDWVQENPENELLFRRMTDVWSEGQFKIHVKGQQTTFNKLLRRLDLDENIFIEDNSSRQSDKWVMWYRVAIVLVFILVATGIIYLKFNTTNIPVNNEQSNIIVKTNPAGQKTRIILPDGSVCWLNSESEIRYLTDFSDSARIIYLQGEAYFQVQKDPFRPFIVHAPNMTVTAIGTIFNISSFRDDMTEVVSLVEGCISVVCNDNTYGKIYPGEAVSYDKKLQVSDKILIDPVEATAWKDGILIFNDDTFKEIFKKIERWYAVKIVVRGNPPETIIYRAKFKNELLVNILESLRYGRDFNYKINDKEVIILFNQKIK